MLQGVLSNKDRDRPLHSLTRPNSSLILLPAGHSRKETPRLTDQRKRASFLRFTFVSSVCVGGAKTGGCLPREDSNWAIKKFNTWITWDRWQGGSLPWRKGCYTLGNGQKWPIPTVAVDGTGDAWLPSNSQGSDKLNPDDGEHVFIDGGVCETNKMYSYTKFWTSNETW